MRIDELNLPKYKESAANILKKAGYKRLTKNVGIETAYALVFYKPGQKSVLKLFDNDDYAYLAFVEMARKHQDNPHFPKFSKGVVDIPGSSYYAVKTELLQEIHADVTLVLRFIKAHLTRNPPAYAKLVLSQKIHDRDALTEAINEFMVGYAEWAKSNPKLVEACEILDQTFGDANGIRFDLHHENIMMRGDTMVFIDPVAPGDGTMFGHKMFSVIR